MLMSDSTFLIVLPIGTRYEISVSIFWYTNYTKGNSFSHSIRESYELNPYRNTYVWIKEGKLSTSHHNWVS
jgi:hypothetical protein